MPKKLYEVLGITEKASSTALSKAYQKKAKEYDLDKHPNDPKNAEKFYEINEAYNILKDPDKRKKYDMGTINEKGEESQATSPTQGKEANKNKPKPQPKPQGKAKEKEDNKEEKNESDELVEMYVKMIYAYTADAQKYSIAACKAGINMLITGVKKLHSKLADKKNPDDEAKAKNEAEKEKTPEEKPTAHLSKLSADSATPSRELNIEKAANYDKTATTMNNASKPAASAGLDVENSPNLAND